jgi:hypothetical protein
VQGDLNIVIRNWEIEHNMKSLAQEMRIDAFWHGEFQYILHYFPILHMNSSKETSLHCVQRSCYQHCVLLILGRIIYYYIKGLDVSTYNAYRYISIAQYMSTWVALGPKLSSSLFVMSSSDLIAFNTRSI